MSSLRELIGNLKNSDPTTHVAFAGALVVDPVTLKVYVHDGSTPGGTEVGGATILAAVGKAAADGGNVGIAGGNSEGTGAGGPVYIDGGSVLADDNYNQGGSIYLVGGGASFGQGGDILIAPGDGPTAGRLYIYQLPTSDPHVANAVWNSSGTLMISAG
jgi:hypothetical protein